ncbi:hypothetical protein ACJJI3_00195 [Microbulbifer sp. ZKSA004]|uniref:hypothetical protein n=1 Tax=Microbulbifer sp. ZKSA004 TaxID=3243389 RepID=UPI0040398775
MSRKALFRRAALAAIHFTRNYAYYKAGWDGNGKAVARNDFWRNANTNFVDQVVLHWCYLFGRRNDRHSYQFVVPNKTQFKADLYDSLSLSEKKFDLYRNKMLKHRDSFIAHLDADDSMYIPKLDVAFLSVKFYFDSLKKFDIDQVYLKEPTLVPENLDAYYESSYEEALLEYDRHQKWE